MNAIRIEKRPQNTSTCDGHYIGFSDVAKPRLSILENKCIC